MQDRQKAIESLRKLRRPAPSDFKFDREEANARDASPAMVEARRQSQKVAFGG